MSQFQKLDDYVSDVLSTSYMVGPTEASLHMFNMPLEMDHDSIMLGNASLNQPNAEFGSQQDTNSILKPSGKQLLILRPQTIQQSRNPDMQKIGKQSLQTPAEN